MPKVFKLIAIALKVKQYWVVRMLLKIVVK